MNECMILLAQTAAISFLGAWMFTGVKDNWLHPALNGDIVGMILRIDKFEEMYPEEFQEVRHRRITSPRFHRLVFGLIVIWESIACLLSLAGAVAMLLALFGQLEVDTARALALLGATWFTSVWAGFLVFGNHWVYWYCHEWGQNSHFQLLLWGLGTMIFLSIAG